MWWLRNSGLHVSVHWLFGLNFLVFLKRPDVLVWEPADLKLKTSEASTFSSRLQPLCIVPFKSLLSGGWNDARVLVSLQIRIGFVVCVGQIAFSSGSDENFWSFTSQTSAPVVHRFHPSPYLPAVTCGLHGLRKAFLLWTHADRWSTQRSHLCFSVSLFDKQTQRFNEHPAVTDPKKHTTKRRCLSRWTSSRWAC